MSTRQNEPDGPEDIDAAFAEIVSDLERDPQFGQWSTTNSTNSTTSDAPTEVPPATPAENPAPTGPRDWTPAEDPEEEHFVPPDPPPLGLPSGGTVLGIAVIVVGLCILLFPGLAGIGAPVTLPLGLVLMSAGIGWLLLRLRRGPSDHDDDDGARV